MSVVKVNLPVPVLLADLVLYMCVQAFHSGLYYCSSGDIVLPADGLIYLLYIYVFFCCCGNHIYMLF